MPPAHPYQAPATAAPGGTPPPVQTYGPATAPDPFNPTPAAPKKKSGLLIGGGIAAVLAIGGAGAVILGGGDDEAAPTTTEAVTTTIEAVDTGTTMVEVAGSPSVERLAQSTVQILVLDAAGNPTCQGSGTILDKSGTILTNAHVITPGGGCEVEGIAIAITDDAGLEPELLYMADLLNFDFQLDLAVLRIASSIDGSPLPDSFPTTEVGDSDAVTIGDSIRILGYPTIGGSTITFTNGSVSGFTSQAGLSDRSWIKTDATISGGNSGGTAVNDEGQLIGIPTQASASEDGPIVDCRVITDTNGDGVTNDADQCTPIGGFLNGIRPVNLALPLIDAAATATPLAPNAAGTAEPQEVAVDPFSVIAYRPGFSLGVGETAETTVFTTTAAAGAQELCFWFDWQNLPTGARWDAVWLIDGEIIEDFSYFSELWIQEESGTDFWLCAQNEEGLAAGLYEMVFFVQDEIIFVEAIEVTPEPVPVYEVEFVNNSAHRICFLKVNPLGATDVGLDELGAEDIIEIGASHTLFVPQGTIIASALNCDGDLVSGSTDGIAIVGDDVITIS